MSDFQIVRAWGWMVIIVNYLIIVLSTTSFLGFGPFRQISALWWVCLLLLCTPNVFLGLWLARSKPE